METLVAIVQYMLNEKGFTDMDEKKQKLKDQGRKDGKKSKKDSNKNSNNSTPYAI